MEEIREIRITVVKCLTDIEETAKAESEGDQAIKKMEDEAESD